MPHDDPSSLAATTAIIRTLARGDPTSHLDVSRLDIPGPNSPEKRALERELVTLINRVRYLEGKAAERVQSLSTIPDTHCEYIFSHILFSQVYSSDIFYGSDRKWKQRL